MLLLLAGLGLGLGVVINSLADNLPPDEQAGGGGTTWPEVARFLAAASIVSVFLLITVIDIEHRLILRIVVLPAVVAVALIGSLDPGRGVTKTLIGVVGWPGVLLALMIAVFAGAAYSLTIVIPQLIQRRYSPHSVIPYGPFLVLGALVIYFFGTDFAAYWARTH
jgi:prepilin signal peptidase PulO-like enzyme (type II secretory pathway)